MVLIKKKNKKKNQTSVSRYNRTGFSLNAYSKRQNKTKSTPPKKTKKTQWEVVANKCVRKAGNGTEH